MSRTTRLRNNLARGWPALICLAWATQFAQASSTTPQVPRVGTLSAHAACAAQWAPLDEPAGAVRVQILKTDGIAGHVRYALGPITLGEQQSYRLTWKARAQRPRVVFVELRQPSAAAGVVGQRVRLTDAWQDYAIDFTVGVSAADFAIHFDFGHDLPTVELAQVSLSSLQQSPVNATPVALRVGEPAQWKVQLAAPCHAVLVPGEQSGTVRVAIARHDPANPAGIRVVVPVAGVQAGADYLLKFRARADGERSAHCTLLAADTADRALGLSEHFQLADGWQEVQRGFVATDNAANAKLEFRLADSDSDVELANLSLHPAANPPQTPPSSRP